MDHHNVREALAFTVPSEFGIEDVWALAVPIDNLDERTLHRHCRVRLPKAQVPIRFINVAEPPATRSEGRPPSIGCDGAGALQDRVGEHAEVCQVLEGLHLEKRPSAYDLCSVHRHG